MKKQVCSILLVVSMLLSFMTPLAASAQDYTPLTFGEQVTVTLAIGESKWYEFTPDATKTYTFVSSDEVDVDPVAVLYNSAMEAIADGDDQDGSNFCITAKLTAGETYYLKAYEFDSNNEGSYTLTVGLSLPTDVFFDEYSLETFVGTKYTLGTHIYPEDADNSLTWTSSDETVATVDENGTISFLGAGETAITVETVNGLTDCCYFTVYDVTGSLELNTENEMVYDTAVETRKETQRYYTFTPEETGYYCLYSYDIHSDGDTAIDPRCWVFDVMYKELAYNDDGGEDVNVSAPIAMTAGESYYFMLELYDSKAVGSYKFLLKQMSTADSVSIDGGDLTMDQGTVMDIYVTYSPADTWQEDYTVTSSDESVVQVEDKTISAVGSGEATVTVTTELGLTDSITVTVLGIDAMEADTTYTLEGNAENFGGTHRYAFTPSESGLYTIASDEAIGAGATVSVSLGNLNEQLRYNNTETNTFSLTYELVAGTTYYYVITLNCEAETSSVAFMLTQEDDSTLPAVTLNTTYEVNITNPGDGVYFVFTPKYTGMYAIRSSILDVALDTKLYVLNSNWETFYSNDDGAGESQFLLEEEFTAGETYYLKPFTFSSDDIGVFGMCVEPLFDLPLPGDVDNNGVVDTTDARLLMHAILEITTLTDAQKADADANNDGKLNSYDVRTILINCVNSPA